MRKNDLDKFYQRHEGYLTVIAGYLENRNIPFIFQSCRLRPESSLHRALPKSPTYLDWWVDEFGNSVLIKNKKLQIVQNHLKIKKEKISCTDLYAHVSTEDLTRISRSAYLGVYQDELTDKTIYVVSFLGIDNYFRTRVFIDGNWIVTSPLIIGFNILNMLADNLKIKNYYSIEGQDGVVTLPAEPIQQWISVWPPQKDFTDVLRNSTFLFNQLIDRKGAQMPGAVV